MKNAISNTDNGVTNTDNVSGSKNGVKNDEPIKTNAPKLSTVGTTSKDNKSSVKLHFLKQSFRTLSVPKKIVEKHLDKDKNEPSRFFGEGVTFKAKLIGILEVEEARGDRMCQEALYELKLAVRAAGEHKQRINIVVCIDGIRLRDEKSGDCLHHHPVHKISFIAQDVADSRAFGYIFGSPDTSHRFFGIKTEKSANQVVMTMRDLFQAVFDVKKREVEIAKQNIEQHQVLYSPFPIPGSSTLQIAAATSNSTGALNVKPRSSFKDEATVNRNAINKTQTGSPNLMDLELELNNLQQGLSQMEKLTPSDPFGPSASLGKEDPFGDSFTPPPCITTPPPAKLPPPPVTGDRRKVSGSTSSTHSQPELHWFDKETRDLFSSEKNLTEGDDKEKKDEKRLTAEGDTRDLYDIFTELDPLGTGRSKPYTDKKDFFQELKNPPKKLLNDLRSVDGGAVSSDTKITSAASFPNSSRSLYAPQEDTEKLYDEHVRKYNSIDSERRITLAEDLTKSESYYESSNAAVTSNDPFETSFANFASFDKNGGTGETESRRSPHVLRTSPANLQTVGIDSTKLSTSSSNVRPIYRDEPDVPSITQSDSFSRYGNRWSRNEAASQQKIVINLRRVLSSADDTDKENDSPVAEDGATVLKNLDAISSPGKGGNESSDSFESIPEPPPRPITSPMASKPPPPLPPKKIQLPITLKPPPRTSTIGTSSHYDYIENYESVSMLSSQHNLNGDVQIPPPLPAPARKPKISSFHDNQIRKRPTKQSGSSDSDYYLTPIGKSKEELIKTRKMKPSTTSSSLNITISQLTSTGFDDLAAMLRIPASALSTMTLKELTECLSKLSIADCQKLESDMSKRTAAALDERRTSRSLKESFDDDSTSFRANFEENFPTKSTSRLAQIDKYAVFRELIEQERLEMEQSRAESLDETSNEASTTDEVTIKTQEMDGIDLDSDKYAALRTIESAKKQTEDNVKETNKNEEMQAELEPKDKKIEITTDLKSKKVTVETTVPKKDTTEPDVGKDWAKFDSEMETTPKEHEQRLHSPWENNAKDVEEEEDEEEEAIQQIRYRKQRTKRWNEDDEDEEEEEEYDGHEDDELEDNWEISKRSLGSSWEESSWRENGWSDRDSLYDDAETSPAASGREQTYQPIRNSGRKRRSPLPPSKKSTQNLPWDEETTTTAQEWQLSRKLYKKYLKDDARKLRTPPWNSGGGGTGERRRYETKEQDELMLLKMMLGKKRLKALEEQLFKHYHEQQQLPQKSAHYRYAKSSSKELIADDEYATAKSPFRCTNKYHAQRPKSADKRSRSSAPPTTAHLRHPDKTEELFSTKKYAQRGPPSRPYSHDELSISEEERWASRSPVNYKKPPSSCARTRNRNQTSPFEDNFTTASPQSYELDDSLSETTSSGHGVKTGGKSSSSSRYLSGKKTPDSKRTLELHSYSAYEYESGRNSRESSQRQSPFEDDFAPPLQPLSIEQKAGDTMGNMDEGFYGGGESIGRTTSRRGRTSRTGRHEHRAKPTSKYYENVELRKRMPDLYYEKLAKEKYKYATMTPAVKERMDTTSMEGKSPKKGKLSVTDLRKHDPFNDNATAAVATTTQTMPRLQNTKSKGKSQSNYDSESDSPPGEMDRPSTVLPSASSKWKDDRELSTFGFTETQQHTRK